jgi:hypothetical protein
MKSERLKKLEVELQDLQQWLKLGLVPKKDLEKHRLEIDNLNEKIDEEKDRLRHLKESGEGEEYTMPKRSAQTKQAYQEAHSIPEIDLEEDEYEDSGLSLDSETYDLEASSLFDLEDGNEEKSENDDEDEEDPFSDRSRWKRGILEDPDANEW